MISITSISLHDMTATDKAESIDRLMDDLDAKQVVTGGDSLNDLSSLLKRKHPGIFVAVGNREELFHAALEKMKESKQLQLANIKLPSRLAEYQKDLYCLNGDNENLVFIPSPLVKQDEVQRIAALPVDERRKEPLYKSIASNALDIGYEILQATWKKKA